MERHVGSVLEKALAKRPEDRFGSVQEFLEALRKAAGMQDVSSEEAFAAMCAITG